MLVSQHAALPSRRTLGTLMYRLDDKGLEEINRCKSPYLY